MSVHMSASGRGSSVWNEAKIEVTRWYTMLTMPSAVKDTPHPLRLHRGHAGLTLRGLASLSGVSYVTISHIENGHAVPHPATRRALAEALGVAPGDIWLADGSPK